MLPAVLVGAGVGVVVARSTSVNPAFVVVKV